MKVKGYKVVPHDTFNRICELAAPPKPDFTAAKKLVRGIKSRQRLFFADDEPVNVIVLDSFAVVDGQRIIL